MQKPISPVYLIERPALDASLLSKHTAQMANTAKQVLMGEQSRIKPAPADQTAALFDHVATDALVHHQQEFLTTRQLSFVQTGVRINSDVLLSNTRILTPPYDADWMLGAGSPLSKIDGSMVTMAAEGYSAAGIGFSLSSPQRVMATIQPVGEYDYNWSCFGNYPSLYNSGGIGITVYRNSDPDPVLNRRATLYQVQAPREFKGDLGQGSLDEVQAGVNEPGFFRIPLAPLDLVLEAQQNYLVWLWTWQLLSGSQGAAFLSFVGCKVPMIYVSTNAVTYPVLH